MMLALLGPIGFPEVMLILAVLALLFGARKLPELGRGLGDGIRNFRSAMRDVHAADDAAPAIEAPKVNDRPSA